MAHDDGPSKIERPWTEGLAICAASCGFEVGETGGQVGGVCSVSLGEGLGGGCCRSGFGHFGGLGLADLGAGFRSNSTGISKIIEVG